MKALFCALHLVAMCFEADIKRADVGMGSSIAVVSVAIGVYGDFDESAALVGFWCWNLWIGITYVW